MLHLSDRKVPGKHETTKGIRQTLAFTIIISLILKPSTLDSTIRFLDSLTRLDAGYYV